MYTHRGDQQVTNSSDDDIFRAAEVFGGLGSITDKRPVVGGVVTENELSELKLDIKNEIKDLRKDFKIQAETIESQKGNFKVQARTIESQKRNFEEQAENMKLLERQFKQQSEKTEKQEKTLQGMIGKQGLTDKAVKILNGLLVGVLVGIVLLLAGIVCDIVRDNTLYDRYIDKTDKMEERISKYIMNEVDNTKSGGSVVVLPFDNELVCNEVCKIDKNKKEIDEHEQSSANN